MLKGKLLRVFSFNISLFNRGKSFIFVVQKPPNSRWGLMTIMLYKTSFTVLGNKLFKSL